MFKRKQTKPQQARIESLIGVDMVVDGDIHFTGGLRIDGKVNGNIVAQPGKLSTLVLSEKSRVKGTIKVSNLMMNGVVTGAIFATEHLELQSHAKVIGEVHYKALEMHHGAVVDGRLLHDATVVEADDKSAKKQDKAEEKVVPLKAKVNE